MKIVRNCIIVYLLILMLVVGNFLIIPGRGESNCIQVSTAQGKCVQASNEKSDVKSENNKSGRVSDYFYMDFNPSSDPHAVNGGFFEGGESWTSTHYETEVQGGTPFDDTQYMSCGWAPSGYTGIYTAVRSDQDLNDGTTTQGAWCSCAREQGGFWPWDNEDSQGWGCVSKSFNLADYVDVTQPGFYFTNATLTCDYKIYSNDFDNSNSYVYFEIYLNDGSQDWPLGYQYYTGASDAPSGTDGGYCIDVWSPGLQAPHGSNPNYLYDDYNNSRVVASTQGGGSYTYYNMSDFFNTYGTAYTLKFKIFVRCYGSGGGGAEQYQFWVDNVRIKCSYWYDSPPTAATPQGPTELLVGQQGTYTTSACDPDFDLVQLRFDFDAEGSHAYSDWSDWVYPDTTVSCACTWNYAGTYVVKAQAVDQWGLEGEWSDGLTVVVTAQNQPPTVHITSPTDGQTVSGTITITGTASDSDGTVVLVEVSIDSGSWQSCTGTTSWSKSWNTTGVSNGQHSISARSKDDDGAYSDVDTIHVNVQNGGGNQQPTVDITYPANGQTVSGAITITGTASDSDGTVVLVEVSIDSGSWQSCTGTTSWSKSWNTASVSDGQHSISARSKDDDGAYSNTDTITVNVQNGGGGSNPPITPQPPSGPAHGRPHKSYTYTAVTTDPDGDTISYIFDWGDGSTTQTDFVASGALGSASHKWSRGKNYQVRVKAVDDKGAESDWSSPISVSITWVKAAEPHMRLIQLILDYLRSLFHHKIVQ